MAAPHQSADQSFESPLYSSFNFASASRYPTPTPQLASPFISPSKSAMADLERYNDTSLEEGDVKTTSLESGTESSGLNDKASILSSPVVFSAPAPSARLDVVTSANMHEERRPHLMQVSRHHKNAQRFDDVMGVNLEMFDSEQWDAQKCNFQAFRIHKHNVYEFNIQKPIVQQFNFQTSNVQNVESGTYIGNRDGEAEDSSFDTGSKHDGMDPNNRQTATSAQDFASNTASKHDTDPKHDAGLEHDMGSRHATGPKYDTSSKHDTGSGHNIGDLEAMPSTSASDMEQDDKKDIAIHAGVQTVLDSHAQQTISRERGGLFASRYATQYTDMPPAPNRHAGQAYDYAPRDNRHFSQGYDYPPRDNRQPGLAPWLAAAPKNPWQAPAPALNPFPKRERQTPHADVHKLTLSLATLQQKYNKEKNEHRTALAQLTSDMETALQETTTQLFRKQVDLVRQAAELEKQKVELDAEKERLSRAVLMVAEGQKERYFAAFGGDAETGFRRAMPRDIDDTAAAAATTAQAQAQKVENPAEIDLNLDTDLDTESNPTVAFADKTTQCDTTTSLRTKEIALQALAQEFLHREAAIATREAAYTVLFKASTSAALEADIRAKVSARLSSAAFEDGFAKGKVVGRREADERVKKEAWEEGWRACVERRAVLRRLRRGEVGVESEEVGFLWEELEGDEMVGGKGMVGVGKKEDKSEDVETDTRRREVRVGYPPAGFETSRTRNFGNTAPSSGPANPPPQAHTAPTTPFPSIPFPNTPFSTTSTRTTPFPPSSSRGTLHGPNFNYDLGTGSRVLQYGVGEDAAAKNEDERVHKEEVAVDLIDLY